MKSLFDNIFAGKNGVAQTLVTTLGAEATISYETRTARNMVDNSIVGEASVSYDIVCSPPLRNKRYLMDDSTVAKADSYCIIPLFDKSGNEIDRPPIESSVTFPTGHTFNVEEVQEYNSGFETAGYKLFLRRV